MPKSPPSASSTYAELIASAMNRIPGLDKDTALHLGQDKVDRLAVQLTLKIITRLVNQERESQTTITMGDLSEIIESLQKECRKIELGNSIKSFLYNRHMKSSEFMRGARFLLFWVVKKMETDTVIIIDRKKLVEIFSQAKIVTH